MYIVPPHELADTWPKVQKWVEEALKYGQGDENLTDVLVALARGIYLLWHEPGEFAGIVQVVKYPRQTVATVLYAGGERERLPRMKEAILRDGLAWCRASGIDCVRIWGRAGWERVLGIPRKGSIMQLDLRAQGSLQ